MNTMTMIVFRFRQIALFCLLLAGMVLMGCSSAPEPQPEPSKKEVQQDSDRFFEKMEKEEKASSYPE